MQREKPGEGDVNGSEGRTEGHGDCKAEVDEVGEVAFSGED